MEFENTIVIELTSGKAMERLLELEVLNFIKVIKEKTEPKKQKLSDKYRDKLSVAVGEKINKQNAQSK